MARAKYSITANDVVHATFYISGQLRNHGFVFRKSVSLAVADREYRAAEETSGKVARASAVNAWCETYLAEEDWKRLKASIRKRRYRSEHHQEEQTITISKTAHELLQKVAARDGVTFSEALEHYLFKAFNASRGRASGRSESIN